MSVLTETRAARAVAVRARDQSAGADSTKPGASPPQSRVSARVLIALLTRALLGFAVGIVLAVTAPMLIGFRSFVVMSGSMEPTIHTGDIVVVEPVRPIETRVGDVITFRDPEERTRWITHRVRTIRRSGDAVRIQTKGDAINKVEQWSISPDGVVGLVRYDIPRLGYLVYWANTRLFRFLLIAVPAVILGIIEVARIWRPRRPKEDASAG